MIYGDHPWFPAQLLLDSVTNDTLYDVMHNWNSDLQLAKRNMEVPRDRQSHYANVHRTDLVFKEGEEVLLSTQNLKLPKGITPKLSNRYTGPFKIVDVVSPTAY